MMKESKIQIKDIRSLIDAIIEANEQLGAGQIWWRGHKDIRWSLRPSIFRETHDRYYEYFITKEFILKAPARHNSIPGKNDYFDWIFLMQHYSLPTRLLDWTESPLVATYFALESSDDKDIDSCIYALHPGLLNSYQGGANIILTSDDTTALSCIKPAFDEKAKDQKLVLSISPSVFDVRIMAQLSMFTIHGSNIAIEELSINDRFLMRFVIPKESREYLKGQLNLGLGIRESNLFPDLEHLAKEIKSHVYVNPR